ARRVTNGGDLDEVITLPAWEGDGVAAIPVGASAAIDVAGERCRRDLGVLEGLALGTHDLAADDIDLGRSRSGYGGRDEQTDDERANQRIEAHEYLRGSSRALRDSPVSADYLDSRILRMVALQRTAAAHVYGLIESPGLGGVPRPMPPRLGTSAALLSSLQRSLSVIFSQSCGKRASRRRSFSDSKQSQPSP